MSKEITRRLQFCSGHRVYGHESQCANLHGHNYVVFITATADTLDSVGRIIDFSVLKEKFGAWIDKFWDHGFLWFNEDEECKALFKNLPKMKNFKCSFNPTAELMAGYLLKEIAPMLMNGTGVTVIKIELQETENCSAVATL